MSAVTTLKTVPTALESIDVGAAGRRGDNERAGVDALAAAKNAAERYRPIADLVTTAEVAGLRLPISAFPAEVEELIVAARAFQPQLIEIGLRPDALTQLEDLLAGVRLCQSIVTLSRTYGERHVLLEVTGRALRLRADVLAAAELACLADARAAAEFDAVAALPVAADLRGVLYSLERLVLHHAEVLRRVRLDGRAVAEELRALADAELDARAQLDRERAEGSWKQLRDKLCVVAGGVVAEVRAHGLYLCRHDEPRRKLFTSRWIRERNRKQRLAARVKAKEAKEAKHAGELLAAPEARPTVPGPAAPVRSDDGVQEAVT